MLSQKPSVAGTELAAGMLEAMASTLEFKKHWSTNVVSCLFGAGYTIEPDKSHKQSDSPMIKPTVTPFALAKGQMMPSKYVPNKGPISAPAKEMAAFCTNKE